MKQRSFHFAFFIWVLIVIFVVIFAVNPLAANPLVANSMPQTQISSTMETIYFSRFAKAMEACYPENFVRYGFETEPADSAKTVTGAGATTPQINITPCRIVRYIELKDLTGKKTQKFFYIDGRLIPGSSAQQLDKNWQDYRAIYAESYPRGFSAPDPKNMNALQKRIIVELGKTENRRNNKPSSFILVQNFIFNAETQRQIEQELVRITFLGERITVHYKIRPVLSRVQAKLEKEALTDASVRRFLERPHTVTGYNWREVRDSYQRSAHSWGLSIDYMEEEKIRGSKQIYWRWAKGFYDDAWVDISLKKRWLPSEKVVAIFESEGFVWGGKWELWDNMHFEYRPEVVYLSSH